MKSTLAFLVCLTVALSTAAQKTEIDDMYFTSKDRAKLRATAAAAKVQVTRTPETAPAAATKEAHDVVNPTDSYSARNVNPEYSTLGTVNSGKTSKSAGGYFIENYVPAGVNGNLKGSSSGTSTPGSFNSPYAYGYSPYSSYGGGWRSGYPYGNSMYGYGPSISMRYGSMFGYNPWVYGGAAYGYGNVWTSPWAMYDPFYDPFYSGSSCPFSFFGYNNYGYGFSSPGYYGFPNTPIYSGADTFSGRDISYQKRLDRSSSEYRADNAVSAASVTRNGRDISAGRVRSVENTQTYYERGWRSNLGGSNESTSSNRSNWSSFDSGNTGAESANWGSSGRSAWDNNSSGSAFTGGSQSRSSYTPSSSGSGGSRTSSGGGSGGGGGHSRGRD